MESEERCNLDTMTHQHIVKNEKEERIPPGGDSTTSSSTSHSLVEESHHENQDDDNDSQHEALCEMLGLTTFSTVDFEIQDNDSIDDDFACRDKEEKNYNVFHRIRLPRNVSRHFLPPNECFAIEIPSLLTPDECQKLIGLASTGGFNYIQHATHVAPDGTKFPVALQNSNPHQLSVFRHQMWVDLLWKRLEPILLGSSPEKNDGTTTPSSPHSLWTQFLQREAAPAPVGLNPRLRVLQYEAAAEDEFPAHFDATTRIDGNISLLTVLVYLNSGGGDTFKGGETYFLNQANASDCIRVTPQVGTVVVFEHDLYHSGHPLECGTKYVLRTDVLFAISENDWAKRAEKAAAKKGLPANIQTAIKDDEDDELSTCIQKNEPRPRPATVKALAESIGWNSSDIQRGLQALDMADISIESFCAPGRFALQAMLQDALRDPSNANNDNLRTMVRRLVDAAFDIL